MKTAFRSLLACLLCFLITGVALAQRPIGPKLLPERTAVMLRIRSFPETRTKFNGTAMGRILTDPEVGPLLSKLYSQVQELYTRVEDRVGVPLEKIVSLPQGEIWVAVVPPVKDGPISVAVLIEAGDHLSTAKKLLERGEELLTENGGRKMEETLAGTKVNIYLPRGVGEPRRETRREGNQERSELRVENGTFVEFEKEGTVVISTTATLAEEILQSWSGAKGTLAENEHFAAVMSRCQSNNDPPEFEWYVDPISLVKAAARGNAGAQVGLALIPALGLDGIQAVGGTATMLSGEFDEVNHFHLLLENPRSGVLELLQMSSGDATPEPWVPHDVVNYMTLNWNFQETYAKGTKVYDGYFGEGSAAKEMGSRVQAALDIDFEKELLPAIEGRVTLAQWNEPPARLNSQANMLGVKLTDAKAFQPVLEKVIAKYPDRLEKSTLGSTTYYKLKLPEPREGQEPPANIRRPEPCLAIVGDYLLLTDSQKFFEHAMKASSSGKTLAGEVDYKLIASKIARQSGGQKPGFVVFARPEEGMRMLYDLATSDDTRRSLSRSAENNEYLKRLEDSLKEHPLPPFAVIAKYLAPSGALMTQDETGFHYMSFTLKRK
jgi:hypothetical protein